MIRDTLRTWGLTITVGMTDIYKLQGYSNSYLMNTNMDDISIPRLDRAYIRQVYYSHSPK